MADIKLVVKIDEDVYTRLFDNGIQDNEIAVDDVCEMARSLRHGTPQPRWIPVSERLPDYNDIVLASTDSDYDELKVILTVYSGEEFWFNGKIKAWRPKPKPYVPQESEDNNGN